MADYEDVYAPDLTEETESTLSGSEQLVMFDSVEGKRAELSTIADYIVENGEIDGSDIPSIVSTIEGNIGTLDTKVGDLTDLDTTDKTDIVSAINEVNGKAEDADAKADTVDEHVGDLSELETEDKTSAVDAINEVLSKIPVMTKEVTGNPIVVDDALGGVQSLTVELTPIQEGSGTPSPQNVRPITGHDSVTVGVTGKNLFDPQKAVQDTASSQVVIDGDWITFRTGSDRLIYNYTVDGAVAFSAIVKSDVATSNVIRFYAYYSDGTNAMLADVTTTDTNEHYITGTTDANKTLIKIQTAWTDGKATRAKEIQLEYGSTASAYEPYKSQTKTVTLPHTVYGGKPNITTGNGTETKKCVDISTLDWSYWQQSGTQNTFYANLTDKAVGKKNMITSIYEVLPTGGYGELADGQIVGADANNYVYLVDNRYNNVADFKTGVAGQTICYELATPTDLTTTPTSVTLYNGDNVVSSDGDMDMVYVRDIVKIIEKLEG